MSIWDKFNFNPGQGSNIQERINNIDYDKLTEEEQAVYRRWLEELESKSLTVTDIAEFTASIKTTLSEEVSRLPSDEEHSKENIYVKARLANIIMLEKFISDRLAAQAEMYRMMAKENAPKLG